VISKGHIRSCRAKTRRGTVYETLEEAQQSAAAANVAEKRKKQDLLYGYPCLRCGKFHKGSHRRLEGAEHDQIIKRLEGGEDLQDRRRISLLPAGARKLRQELYRWHLHLRDWCLIRLSRALRNLLRNYPDGAKRAGSISVQGEKKTRRPTYEVRGPC